MNGVQLSVFIYEIPKPIKRRITATLIKTIMLLIRLDSLIPTYNNVETKTTRITAGKFIILPVKNQPSPGIWFIGAEQNSGGIIIPKSFKKLTK